MNKISLSNFFNAGNSTHSTPPDESIASQCVPLLPTSPSQNSSPADMRGPSKISMASVVPLTTDKLFKEIAHVLKNYGVNFKEFEPGLQLCFDQYNTNNKPLSDIVLMLKNIFLQSLSQACDSGPASCIHTDIEKSNFLNEFVRSVTVYLLNPCNFNSKLDYVVNLLELEKFKVCLYLKYESSLIHPIKSNINPLKYAVLFAEDILKDFKTHGACIDYSKNRLIEDIADAWNLLGVAHESFGIACSGVVNYSDKKKFLKEYNVGTLFSDSNHNFNNSDTLEVTKACFSKSENKYNLLKANSSNNYMKDIYTLKAANAYLRNTYVSGIHAELLNPMIYFFTPISQNIKLANINNALDTINSKYANPQYDFDIKLNLYKYSLAHMLNTMSVKPTLVESVDNPTNTDNSLFSHARVLEILSESNLDVFEGKDSLNSYSKQWFFKNIVIIDRILEGITKAQHS